MKAKICECCGQRIQEAHKEVLNKHKLIMLKAAAKYSADNMKATFTKRELAEVMENHSNYANFQKLRYHGLVTPARDEAKNRIKGKWLITRNGWAFLRGEIALPSYVIIKNNAVESHSDRTVGFKDIWRGEDFVYTTFEYFDDEGRPVGVRPVAPSVGNSAQSKLFDIPARY